MYNDSRDDGQSKKGDGTNSLYQNRPEAPNGQARFKLTRLWLNKQDLCYVGLAPSPDHRVAPWRYCLMWPHLTRLPQTNLLAAAVHDWNRKIHSITDEAALPLRRFEKTEKHLLPRKPLSRCHRLERQQETVNMSIGWHRSTDLLGLPR